VPDEAGGRLTARDYGLYAVTVFVWGTSWIALHYQLGTVAPQVSLTWRFALAALVMLAWCRATGRRLAFPLSEHWRFAGLGLFLFCVNFEFFYYAGERLVSGLLAVMFSLAAVINILMAALLLREPIRPRVAFGALVGLAGIACLFWPEIAGGAVRGALGGLALGIAGTLSFSLGNMLSVANGRAGIPVVSASAIGMCYGTAFNALGALIGGHAFIIDWSLLYVGSLLWLTVLSTVVAFWAYLTLAERIGADRAGYATVMFPIIALLISTAVEGYRWTPLAALGVALALLGNAIVLSGRRRPA